MAGLDVFIGENASPVLRISEGLWSYLDATGFSVFATDTNIQIHLGTVTSFDAEFLLSFFLALEPVVGQLRTSTDKYTTEVGLDETSSQIVAFEVPREEAIRDIDSLMTAANDAYNEDLALTFKPVE